MNASYDIYGLRLTDDREVRYVGLTRKLPRDRLRQHIYRAVGTQSGTPFGQWLLENREAIEAFGIAACDGREEAKSTEKVVIALCERLNQRLFNLAHTQEKSA